MITFLLCIAALVLAYFTYGKYLDKVCRIDPRHSMPSQRLYDGVDYVPMPRWRLFFIQLLNIAGTGPIFGAILGACYGPVIFLWITLGGIFMGAMQDYLSGMLIVRTGGRSLPEVFGRYMGPSIKWVMRVLLMVTMIFVAAVFVLSPASVLKEIVPAVPQHAWILLIMAYFLLSTVMKVDKFIGKIYPFFGAALILMMVFMLFYLITGDAHIPELDFRNHQLHADKLPILPTLFITVACGAISGMHVPQSPMVARCINNEREGRFVFYGAMITESLIALVWAAASMAFFQGPEALGLALAQHGNSAAWAVNTLTSSTLGKLGAVIAIFGVVLAPITTGDTSMRAARLILADMFNYDQKPVKNRIFLAIPLFLSCMFFLMIEFDILWRYMAWLNQLVAAVVLWTVVIAFYHDGKNYYPAIFPALFMSFISSSVFFISPQFVPLHNRIWAYLLGILITLIPLAGFHLYRRKLRKKLWYKLFYMPQKALRGKQPLPLVEGKEG